MKPGDDDPPSPSYDWHDIRRRKSFISAMRASIDKPGWPYGFQIPDLRSMGWIYPGQKQDMYRTGRSTFEKLMQRLVLVFYKLGKSLRSYRPIRLERKGSPEISSGAQVLFIMRVCMPSDGSPPLCTDTQPKYRHRQRLPSSIESLFSVI